MDDQAVAAVVVPPAAALGVVTALWLRTRLPAVTVAVLLAAAGAALGWGLMLLRTDPSVGEAVAAIVLLGILVPAHVRIVLGRFGPAGAGEPSPATAPEPRPDTSAEP